MTLRSHKSHKTAVPKGSLIRVVWHDELFYLVEDDDYQQDDVPAKPGYIIAAKKKKHIRIMPGRHIFTIPYGTKNLLVVDHYITSTNQLWYQVLYKEITCWVFSGETALQKQGTSQSD